MRCGLDLGRLSHGFIRYEPTFRIDQVRCKNGVDERRLPQAGWSYMMQVVRGLLENLVQKVFHG
jgi:hypothetical protein